MKLYNDNLRKLRISLGLTQEYIAYVIGKEQSTYNRIENGKIKLTIEHIPLLSKALEMNELEVLNFLLSTSIDNLTTNNILNENSQIKIKSDNDNIIRTIEENTKFIHVFSQQLKNK